MTQRPRIGFEQECHNNMLIFDTGLSVEELQSVFPWRTGEMDDSRTAIIPLPPGLKAVDALHELFAGMAEILLQREGVLTLSSSLHWKPGASEPRQGLELIP